MNTMEMCINCKNLGDFIEGASYRCKLHGHQVMESDRACFWKNQDMRPSGRVTDHGVIIHDKRVVLREKGYKHVAYRVAEYSGRWFAGLDCILTDAGHCFLPNIADQSYASKQEAIMSVLRKEYEHVKKMRNEQDIEFFRSAFSKVLSPTLF